MTYISAYQYYENGGNPPENANWGSYQYVSLEDIVTNFQLMYAGNHSLVNNEERYKILFHAKNDQTIFFSKGCDSNFQPQKFFFGRILRRAKRAEEKISIFLSKSNKICGSAEYSYSKNCFPKNIFLKHSL